MLDTMLKVLGVVLSIAAFVVGAAFFFGGEWERWKDVKAYVNEQKARPSASTPGAIDTSQFVRFGHKVQIRANVGYLAGGATGRPETSVTLSAKPNTGWEIEETK